MLRSNLFEKLFLLINICYSNAFNMYKVPDTYLLREPFTSRLLDIASDVSEEFFTQRLDNFDPQNEQTFEMVRLFV